jgi:magnesium-transporting ATPase (P-type)
VEAAVKTCRQAGIRMVMITGDYGLTAESLARRVGMLSSQNPVILTGAELDEMSESELNTILDQEVIFARMAPDHKLRLVAAYQNRGEVVAVTGDGVNDAPALRKADVGVAMGIIGTDVAKESADLIITNDNFATIVNAIEEGRAVYDNLRKFITYIFSSNVPEIIPFLLTAMFNLPLALTVKQILAIDLGTDLFPALALGTERPEPDVMQRPPRRRSQPLIDGKLLRRAFLWLGMIEAVLCFTGFFLVLGGPALAELQHLPLLSSVYFLNATVAGTIHLPYDVRYALAVTIFHAGVVMAQVGNAFACRTETNHNRYLGWVSNRLLLLGIAVELMLILLLIYFPPLAKAFDHLPLPPHYWIGLLLFPPILYSLEWLRKGVARRKNHAVSEFGVGKPSTNITQIHE